MVAMRRFYEEVLAFPLLRELSPNWIEYGGQQYAGPGEAGPNRD